MMTETKQFFFLLNKQLTELSNCYENDEHIKCDEDGSSEKKYFHSNRDREFMCIVRDFSLAQCAIRERDRHLGWSKPKEENKKLSQMNLVKRFEYALVGCCYFIFVILIRFHGIVHLYDNRNERKLFLASQSPYNRKCHDDDNISCIVEH